jgi:hypothetical protein
MVDILVQYSFGKKIWLFWLIIMNSNGGNSNANLSKPTICQVELLHAM